MSTEAFNASWAKTGRAEQGYVKNPNDSGCATNHGITEATARAHGYTGDMLFLDPVLAREIAKKSYWDVLGLDAVAALSAPIAEEVFDTGFLCGVGTSGRFLQRALNAFNRSHRAVPDYHEVTEDGIVGANTAYALKLYLQKRSATGVTVMLRCLNSQQGRYLMDIAKVNPKNEDFMYGWFEKRVVI